MKSVALRAGKLISTEATAEYLCQIGREWRVVGHCSNSADGWVYTFPPEEVKPFRRMRNDGILTSVQRIDPETKAATLFAKMADSQFQAVRR